MGYNRNEVAQRAKDAIGRPNTPGTCQAWTRGIVGVHAVGDVDGDGDADAVDGWKSEPSSARHENRNPPAGVPIAWSGGRNGYGHRAVSIGGGRVVSTDAPVNGRVGVVSLDWFEKNWGLKYLGWSDTMSGVKIATTPVKTTSELEVISWNVNRKSNPNEVRSEITKMIDRYNPDVIYLYEAIRLYGKLEDLGYQVRQLKPRKTKSGQESNRSNIVVLVRNGLTIRTSKATRMKLKWKFKASGKAQPTRVFRMIKIKKQGVVWKIGGVHFPLGSAARVEAIKYVTNLIKLSAKTTAVVVLGDFNMDDSKVASEVGKPAGAKTAGGRTDAAVYNNCRLADERILGKNGSDHAARRYVFEKTVVTRG